jgi:hypothetical protein
LQSAHRRLPDRARPDGDDRDDQGDFIEVDLDFSVMAPPPRGDTRIVNPAPPGNNELLGEAYGASFRLINPLENNTNNFLAAWLGAGFVQLPAPSVITASIGEGFGIGGFSDYFFEQEAIIHDAVSLLVNGADIFVSISAGDGQTATAAVNPNGLTGRRTSRPTPLNSSTSTIPTSGPTRPTATASPSSRRWSSTAVPTTPAATRSTTCSTTRRGTSSYRRK